MTNRANVVDPYATLVDLVGVRGAQRVARLQELIPELRSKAFTEEGREGVNLFYGPERPLVWVGAHHDLDPDTQQGALDNTASVAVLVAMIKSGRIPEGVAVAFWDGEEPGRGGAMDGSSVHGRELRRQAQGGPKAPVVALDVLGIGELTMAGNWGGTEFLKVLEEGGRPAELAVVPQTPESDHVAMLAQGVPSALLVAMPRDEKGAFTYAHWGTLHSGRDNLGQVRAQDLRGQADHLGRFLAQVVEHEREQPGRHSVSTDLGMAAADMIRAGRRFGAFDGAWRTRKEVPRTLPGDAPGTCVTPLTAGEVATRFPQAGETVAELRDGQLAWEVTDAKGNIQGWVGCGMGHNGRIVSWVSSLGQETRGVNPSLAKAAAAIFADMSLGEPCEVGVDLLLIARTKRSVLSSDTLTWKGRDIPLDYGDNPLRPTPVRSSVGVSSVGR